MSIEDGLLAPCGHDECADVTICHEYTAYVRAKIRGEQEAPKVTTTYRDTHCPVTCLNRLAPACVVHG